MGPMIRYAISIALLLLAISFMTAAAQLLMAARRLAAGAKPMPPNVAAVAADEQPMQERYDVTMTVRDILHRTLH
jgi:hypothetical protein